CVYASVFYNFHKYFDERKKSYCKRFHIVVISRHTIGHMMTSEIGRKCGDNMEQKRTNIRWYFAIAFFIIGVIAYMDRSNISIIAGAMIEVFYLTKTLCGLLASIFSLCYASM